MKCLEKDRTRRYETANGLARDVEQLIEGDAVEACPPTLSRSPQEVLPPAIGQPCVSSACSWGSHMPGPRASISPTSGPCGPNADWEWNATRLSGRGARPPRLERPPATATRCGTANASLRALTDRQRQTLYASAMNLAQAAWESGDARRTVELLRQWVPKPGEEDLRGFEWHYWNRQAHQEARSVRLQGLTPRERSTALIGAVSRDGTRAAGAWLTWLVTRRRSGLGRDQRARALEHALLQEC